MEQKKLMYAVVYFLEKNKLKRIYKGIYTSKSSIWRLSNFLDDLLLAKADYPIICGVICTGHFPLTELDGLIKTFLKIKNEQTIYHG